MPPKKRSRPETTAPVTEEPSKRTRNAKLEEPSSLPSRPRTDSYRPAEKTEAKIHDFIKRTATRLTKGRQLKEVELVLKVSTTEADLLLGKDGSTNINTITNLAKASISVSDKVQRSVDREITITGDSKSAVIVLLAVVVFLNRFVDENSSLDTVYHFTLLVSHQTLHAIGLATLRAALPNADFSSQFVPFSNYRTGYFEGKLVQLVEDAVVFLNEAYSKELKPNKTILEIFPTLKVPVDGIYHPTRSEETQELVEKSRVSLSQYLKQETQHTKSATPKIDAKQRTKAQIEQAIQDCNRQLKSLEQLKYTLHFPIDAIPKLNLTEIRSKSNSNVVVLDQVLDENYKQLKVTGLAESNLIAFRFLLKVL